MFFEDIKITVFILLIGVFVIVFLSSIQVVVAADIIDDQIIFTEIMYDLDGGDDGREWVEIYNNSNHSIEINSDWRFFDGSNHLLTIVQGDQTLDSGEMMVITDNADNFLIDHPEFTGSLVDSVVKLNNTGEEIKLSLDNGETWVAQFEYTSDLGANGDGYSLEYLNNVWQPSVDINGNPNYYYQSEADAIVCPTIDTNIINEDNINEVDDTNDTNEDSNTNDVNNANNANTNANDTNLDEVTDIVEEVVYSNMIIINELVPDPDGSDEEGEYIELFNNDAQDVDLDGWSIEDSSGKEYILSGVVLSNDYTTIYRLDSKITLNNSSGDLVKLFNPASIIVDQIEYDKSIASQSYSRFAIEWSWTESLTPGAVNEAPVEIVEDLEEEESGDDQVEELEEIELQLQLISEIKDMDLNSEVYTQGVVTVLPGHFAQTYFYISEIDFEGMVNLSVGIQIYFSKKDFPEMFVGDVIVILGKLSETSGEKRIKISQQDDIQVLDSIILPDVDELLTGEINDDYEGGLIQVFGDLVDKKSTSWYLDDDSGEIRVYISSKTGITKPEVELGQELGVVGIVSETKSGFRLLPRFDEDFSVETIVVEQDEPEVSVIAARSKQHINVVDNNDNDPADFLGYGLGVVGLSIVSWVVKLKFF
jgi:Lamin Tail Domain